MSAKSAGLALPITIAIILLILAMSAVPVISGDDESLRLLSGDSPTAPSVFSHSHLIESSGMQAKATPPKPKDVQAYLPMLTRPNACELNEEEQAIADLATGDPEQERETMSCHPILAQVARQHAVDMATRDYFDLCDPEGFGPNYRVERAGYDLPEWYDQEELCDETHKNNNVESIAAHFTFDTPEEVWDFWLDDNGHSDHVLGEGDFFAGQTNYGIGYAFAAGSTYKHYWVFISAHPQE